MYKLQIPWGHQASLTFTKHLKTTIKNVSYRISKLKRIRNAQSKETALQIFKWTIPPIFDSGDIFYQSNSLKYFKKLQVLQTKLLDASGKEPQLWYA